LKRPQNGKRQRQKAAAGEPGKRANPAQSRRRADLRASGAGQSTRKPNTETAGKILCGQNRRATKQDFKVRKNHQIDCPTVCVSRWWAGRDKTPRAGKTRSQKTAYKPRRIPPVGCTLCSAALGMKNKTGAMFRSC